MVFYTEPMNFFYSFFIIDFYNLFSVFYVESQRDRSGCTWTNVSTKNKQMWFSAVIISLYEINWERHGAITIYIYIALNVTSNIYSYSWFLWQICEQWFTCRSKQKKKKTVLHYYTTRDQEPGLPLICLLELFWAA